MTHLWHTLYKSSEHYSTPEASIHIYDSTYVVINYMLEMGMSEQIERKTYVTCCVKNYKKIKKMTNLYHILKKSIIHYWTYGSYILIVNSTCIYV